jgi:hypothetical protein
MKKLIVLAFMALSMLTARTTTSPTTNKGNVPFPSCDPCQWVR